tara:strand:- start:2159 stop:2425 length:267 start_codon:yes stop_codon:yes gene_type:complete
MRAPTIGLGETLDFPFDASSRHLSINDSWFSTIAKIVDVLLILFDLEFIIKKYLIEGVYFNIKMYFCNPFRENLTAQVKETTLIYCRE